MRKIKYIAASLKVWLAYCTNNSRGKTEDVHGRTYRLVHDHFGHDCMVAEYLHGNSWFVR